MTPIDGFSVVPLPAADDVTPATATVHRDGQPTGVTLRGAVLEAALARPDGFILILSDDVPWEEGINIHLLDPALGLRDSVWMGWPYTPGTFSGLTLQPPDSLIFRFPAGTLWRLTVLAAPRRALPMPDWIPGIGRPATWWRWLDLARLPD